MTHEPLPALGKIHPAFFDRVIYPQLGAEDKRIVIGPRHGVDYGVLKVGDQYLAMSTDPFFIVPQLGFERAAWFAFHIIMSDVAVSGLTPKFLTIDLNLPPEMKESEIEEMWGSVHREAEKYNISIITGHTARYAGCNYPMVGGATGIAIGSYQELCGPQLVKKGDKVIVTKGGAVETTGLLAALFPHKFIEAGGEKLQQAALGDFPQMSVMYDCAIARQIPGIHAMHDATECGIWGGLYEMARAGKYGLVINEDQIPLQPVIAKTAELFDFDPLAAISEGTLIAIVDHNSADKLVAAFEQAGILSAIIGEVVSPEVGVLIEDGRKSRKLEHPTVDPYWQLVERFTK